MKRSENDLWKKNSEYTQAQQRGPSQFFNVPPPKDIAHHFQKATMSRPQEIACFSKYADGKILFDRSKLTSYSPPRIGADLLEGVDKYTPKDDTQGELASLGPFLGAIEDKIQKQQLHLKQHHFVTYRNNMNKILGTPYNTNNGWTFHLEKHSGCVFLDVRMTEEDQRRKQNEHPSANQLHGIYAGRYFEVLSTINEQQQVNEEEEYCGIFTLHLGTKRLLIAAEIDCEDPKTKEYIELKTFRNLATSKDQFVFERFKLLAFWIQSYLVGTPKIICGFRNEKYQLTKLQTFKTTEIPSFCRKYWDQRVCLNFASEFLDWLYQQTEENHVYSVTYDPKAHRVEINDLKDIQTESFIKKPLVFH